MQMMTMRHLGARLWGLLMVQAGLCGVFAASIDNAQSPITTNNDDGISVGFFSELERLARIVDISYCIGNTGISKPFSCVSRCDEFPTMTLVKAWNTGIMLSDSCGYIAIDNGEPNDQAEAADHEVGNKAIVLAFRGTYSIANTIVDLSTVPQEYVPYPIPGDDGDVPQKPGPECKNCTVHMGFFESWKNARKEVMPEVIALKKEYPSYPIHLVGHSLGGAVACLAALEMKVSMGWDNVIVTTFGEPRVGNVGLTQFIDEVFALDGDSDLEKQTYRRLTHYNDPVPLLPLGEWGYRSHAGEFFITKESLTPSETDIHSCVGDNDQTCSAGSDSGSWDGTEATSRVDMIAEAKAIYDNWSGSTADFPTRYKLWQLFFAHRDYFWRIGLCVPGGDPWNWGRAPYGGDGGDEL